jgi:hypothetical protein
MTETLLGKGVKLHKQTEYQAGNNTFMYQNSFQILIESELEGIKKSKRCDYLIQLSCFVKCYVFLEPIINTFLHC